MTSAGKQKPAKADQALATGSGGEGSCWQSACSGPLIADATAPLHAIRVVAAGEALLAPRITRRLIVQFTAARTAHQVAEDRLAVLTQREREVLALVGEGLSNSEIAERLVLSPAMARTHVSRAMVKLGARDRAQLVVVAYQTGVGQPRPARLTPLRPRATAQEIIAMYRIARRAPTSA